MEVDMNAKKYEVSKRAVILGFVSVMILFVIMLVLLFGFLARGKAISVAATKLEVCEKAAKKPQPVAKKPQVPKKKITPVAKQAAPTVPAAQVTVPNYGATKLILRINVVEWSEDFAGKSLMSRDIGPVIRQGLADGTVVRTKEPLGFLVNGASVVVRDGSAIVDPGTINTETVLIVQPSDGVKFASPPNGLPLTTNPGELDAVVKQGVSEIWMSFILVPPAT